MFSIRQRVDKVNGTQLLRACSRIISAQRTRMRPWRLFSGRETTKRQRVLIERKSQWARSRLPLNIAIRTMARIAHHPFVLTLFYSAAQDAGNSVSMGANKGGHIGGGR